MTNVGKQYLEITARVPMPEELIDAHPIQTAALEVAKKFRDDLAGKLEKLKVEAAVSSRVVKEKAPRGTRKAKGNSAAGAHAPGGGNATQPAS